MSNSSLSRQLGLMGLIATGVCSMLGASINVVPFMIQRHVPGIGPYVLHAFIFAAIPAILAAVAYSMLATAMPRAGGSYIYASRGLNPYLGFVASFSQWFGLSIVIGVVAYVTIPFLRDIALALQWEEMASALNTGLIRVALALILVWVFVWVNIRGAKSYEKTVIPLMVLMFLMGGVVIIAGFIFSSTDFIQSVFEKTGQQISDAGKQPFHLPTFLSAAALLFASFIGFDSIAQAGGEAKEPTKKLPLAIGLTILIVGGYYMLFTAAVYHTVPWSFVAEQAMQGDITAPGLLSYLLPSWLTVIIVGGAAIALVNDLPAMLLSVSRLMFAWAEDGIFPHGITKIHPRFQTPYLAIILSGLMASVGILGSHFAGNFFLGIDIMVTSMMVNFLLMCLTLLFIEKVNPKLAEDITIFKSKAKRRFIGFTGTLVLLFFLFIHTLKDLQSQTEAWYFHSTPIWLIVMALASLIFYVKFSSMKKNGVDTKKLFQQLP
ncbi:APC family permease [Cecembia calidifontis]|uniref:Amino acid/polyamine/organocation transporter (APC superfamily) n=1 Tax=Cecembia calidifontis TaxID=1187080 RepID=A0A4Q7P5D7_9BACT|nr:APC family permease [Cecembia calidifontis]RZS95236.1 amino acid/polyamine/organocation transporter (APC superfamily) [Cecembia calidifontis]